MARVGGTGFGGVGELGSETYYTISSMGIVERRRGPMPNPTDEKSARTVG